MNISVVGTGYVGLVAGVCFADSGHKVHCLDIDEAKITGLQNGEIPIYEPGLKTLLENTKNRIQFTTSAEKAIDFAPVIFIAVGTPEKADGNADLGPTMAVAKDIARYAKEDKFVVLKSTVPIGTCKEVQAILSESSHNLEVINNPEFLKEGAAIDDFLKPDRVVIGCRSEEAKKVMTKVYEPFVRNGKPIIFMDNVSAEMTKYAANAFLSVKISFINELANLADEVGADIDSVRKGFTSDARISPAFFYPGVGYGGSCFPKDVQALIATAKKMGRAMEIVEAADEVNDRQKLILAEKVLKHFGSVKGKTLALWGLSFKPRTDDVREAPAKYIAEKLLAEGAKIKAFCPQGANHFVKDFGLDIQITESKEEATQGADALLLVTEWNQFRNPDWELLKSNLNEPVVFDGRNIFNPEELREQGFKHYNIGRSSLAE